MTWAALLRFLAMGLSAYSMFDEYCSGAERNASAPDNASVPDLLKASAIASIPAAGPYIRRNDSKALKRAVSSAMSGSKPYVSKFPTDATGTPLQTNALGRPRPKFIPVKTFSLAVSRSRIAAPSQPTDPIFSGSAVYQISLDLK